MRLLQMLVLYVDASSEDQDNVFRNHGVSRFECPALIYFNLRKQKQYKLTDSPLVWPQVQRFISDAIDEKIPVRLSEHRMK